MSDPKNSSRGATIPVRDPSLPLSSNKHLLREEKTAMGSAVNGTKIRAEGTIYCSEVG
jgi:hypothetical protein